MQIQVLELFFVFNQHPFLHPYLEENEGASQKKKKKFFLKYSTSF